MRAWHDVRTMLMKEVPVPHDRIARQPEGEFVAFPKIPRLNRDMVVTEKLDGANAAVGVLESGYVYAQSRKRMLTLDDDSFGFARWVDEHRDELAELGPGVHFGEWWGQGINRGYGLRQAGPDPLRRFSLINTGRWREARPDCCHVVPVLHEGPFSTEAAALVLAALAETGSAAAPGFMQPEGIIVFHRAANMCFKATVHKDEAPKSKEA